ncbi:MAG: hydrolase [Clostridia bacterium]|nr:hydrolase [Clostridia bacterium]
MSDKDEFIEIYTENIVREGAKGLLDWLCDEKKSDFFVAPASMRFHSNCEGGLVRHSLNVYDRLIRELADEGIEIVDVMPKADNALRNRYCTMESVAIVSLLHDICKVNYYKQELRNIKVNGEWKQVPYYTVDEKFPFGHSEKSVYMINNFMRLDGAEALAINWHMGGFDARVKGGSYSLSTAFYTYPLAVLLHIADIKATYLDETVG